MPEEIDLEAYCEEIEDLIREGRGDEAIAAARHILSVYPKFIEAYRLLGKACLEKGDLASAADMFLRVLSADPEDLIAYVGLADVYRAQGRTEQAIWALERALDLEPSHKELRNELENLYREIGVTELIPHYTLAGLGRTYMRGGLLEQAVQTLNEALAREPERVDIRVSLAEAQWRMGKRLEAAQTCLDVLDTLPHCLKANLILGYLLSSINASEARLRLEVAQALDPLNRKAWELFGKDSPLKPRRVKIPRPEVVPAPPLKKEVPLWLEPFELEEKVPSAPEVEGLPLPEEEVEELFAKVEEEAIPEEIVPGPVEEAVPPEEEAPVELPPWLEEEVSEELPAEELPPWLREELGPEEAFPPPWTEEEAAAPPWPEEGLTEEIPSWLREEVPLKEAPAPSWPEEEVPPAEVPPWLSEEAAPPVLEITGEIPAPSWPEAEIPEEIPPWLVAEEAPVPEEKVTEEEIAAPPRLEEIEEEVVPAFEEEKAPPEYIPPSWIESLKPLAESLIEEEIEAALALEAEMAVEEMPALEEEKPPAPPPPRLEKREELLETARLHAREGAWEEALRLYRKLARNKKFQEEVLRDLEGALERGVDISGLFELLGDIYRDRGFLDKALEFYRKALRQ